MNEITAPAILGQGYVLLLMMMERHGFAEDETVRAHMIDAAIRRSSGADMESLWSDPEHNGEDRSFAPSDDDPALQQG
jgi:hypothetical protein